jgi:hypothetical protein
MKSYSIPQMRTVTGNTPQEAAMLFNELMMELAPMRPTFVREGNVYYVQYLVEYREAETITEQHELNGEYDKCYTCPFCVKDQNRFGQTDTRKKWATCSKTGSRVRIDGSVCDEYYKGKEE